MRRDLQAEIAKANPLDTLPATTSQPPLTKTKRSLMMSLSLDSRKEDKQAAATPGNSAPGSPEKSGSAQAAQKPKAATPQVKGAAQKAVTIVEPTDASHSEDYAAASTVDLETATTLLSQEEKALFKKVFERYQESGRPVLCRRGMISALRDIGYTPTTLEDQKTYRAVQDQILMHTRGLQSDPRTDPMKTNRGWWELDEFILMLEALHEIQERHLRQMNSAMAQEFKMPLSEVEEFHKVFQTHETHQNCGYIERNDLKVLLQDSAVTENLLEDDFSLLLESVSLELHKRFEFPDFLRIIHQVHKLMAPPPPPPKEIDERKTRNPNVRERRKGPAGTEGGSSGAEGEAQPTIKKPVTGKLSSRSNAHESLVKHVEQLRAQAPQKQPARR